MRVTAVTGREPGGGGWTSAHCTAWGGKLGTELLPLKHRCQRSLVEEAWETPERIHGSNL